MQRKHNLKLNYNSMGFDKIEINLVGVVGGGVGISIIDHRNEAISQLLLAQFWPNFKRRFLGPSRANSNCHNDICPGNIFPGNICPYQ